ncbi:MAG: YggS family pyridoxal phosphate-dependent enzyme [Actinomycetota bacterium]
MRTEDLEVRERLGRVHEEIRAAAGRAGRDTSEITVVAVSKEVPIERILEAFEAGQRRFGENRVQELLGKIEQPGAEGMLWHFVGRLQRNKVRSVLEKVELIHSLDRIELAEEIDRRADAPVEVLVEVNTSGEPTKAGVPPGELRALLRRVIRRENISVRGLMTMAPVVSAPEATRPFFRMLADLRDRAASEFPDSGIHHLSMGMSQDYAVAVEEGATILRIGEAIFGSRHLTGERH